MIAPVLLGLGLLAASAPPPLFSSAADQVRLDVAAARDGEPIVGLEAKDFEIRDNGQRQRATLLSRDEPDVHAILVLDLSSSLDQANRRELKQAASVFLRQLGPADRATLLTFTHDLRLISGPGDPATVAAAVDDLDDVGTTALLDAVYAGLTVATAAAGRPFVIVFTDGLDRISWVSPHSVLEAARGLEATVYVVGTGDWSSPWVPPADPNDLRPPGGDDGLGRSPAADAAAGQRFLRRLVHDTGGRIWTGRSRKDLQGDLTRVLAEVKSRYVLVYDVAGERKPGWHRIDVRLRGRKGEIRTRRGYFVR